LELNENKADTVRPIGPIRCEELLYRLKQIKSEEWDTDEDYFLNYNKQILQADKKNIAALGGTKHMVFRFSNKKASPFVYFESKRWNQWADVLLPVMHQATAHLNYKKPYYPKVMLANLPAKSFIRPHTDGSAEKLSPHKIHIPLVTNQDCFFYEEQVRFHFEEGMAYEVNNVKTHSVINNGTTDRIHLVFECIDFDLQPEVTKHQITHRNITEGDTP